MKVHDEGDTQGSFNPRSITLNCRKAWRKHNQADTEGHKQTETEGNAIRLIL